MTSTARPFETVSKSINSVRNSVYKPGDVIEIDIPATDAAVISPRQTVIKFHVKMLDGNVCAQPDGLAGAWALIKTLQIFDLNTNLLLEQISEANHLVSLMKHYSKTPSISNNWELMHGQCPNFRPNSLYYDQSAAGGAVVNNAVEVVMNLQVSGILKASAALFPNILVGGLRIRITLEQAAQCLTTYPCVRLGDQLTLDQSLDIYPQGCGGGIAAPNLVAPSTVPPTNSYFAVHTASLAGVITSIVLKDAIVAGAIPVTTDDCQVKVGQRLAFRSTALGAAATTAVISTPVTAVVDNGAGAGFTITFAANANNIPAMAADDPVWILGDDLTATYEVSNFEFIVSSAEYSPEHLRDLVGRTATEAGMNVEYKSWNIYRDNLHARTSAPQVSLNTTERRALSLVQMPYNPTAVIGQPRPPMRTINDEGLNYQYNIANRNTPSRPVLIGRVASNTPLAFNAVHGLEVEKAIDRCSIASRFMCDNNSFFIFGRALSRMEHSFDANTNNIRLSILYSTAATANTIDKVLESQVYHNRRLNISNGNLTLSF
jgi:hypothetical protein